MPVVQKGRGATNYAQRGMGVKLKEGSGGPSIDLINLLVTNNGEWIASEGQAYKKVIANVPTYTKNYSSNSGSSQVSLPANFNFDFISGTNSGATLVTYVYVGGYIADAYSGGDEYKIDFNKLFSITDNTTYIYGDEMTTERISLSVDRANNRINVNSDLSLGDPTYEHLSLTVMQYIFS